MRALYTITLITCSMANSAKAQVTTSSLTMDAASTTSAAPPQRERVSISLTAGVGAAERNLYVFVGGTVEIDHMLSLGIRGGAADGASTEGSGIYVALNVAVALLSLNYTENTTTLPHLQIILGAECGTRSSVKLYLTGRDHPFFQGAQYWIVGTIGGQFNPNERVYLRVDGGYGAFLLPHAPAGLNEPTRNLSMSAMVGVRL